MKRIVNLPPTIGALLTTLHVMVNNGVSPDTIIHVFHPEENKFLPLSVAEYEEGSMMLQADDEYDEEIPRWQVAIHNLLVAECGQYVDGTGCESGDPLNIMLAEIELAFKVAKERCVAKCEG